MDPSEDEWLSLLNSNNWGSVSWIQVPKISSTANGDVLKGFSDDKYLWAKEGSRPSASEWLFRRDAFYYQSNSPLNTEA